MLVSSDTTDICIARSPVAEKPGYSVVLAAGPVEVQSMPAIRRRRVMSLRVPEAAWFRIILLGCASVAASFVGVLGDLPLEVSV